MSREAILSPRIVIGLGTTGTNIVRELIEHFLARLGKRALIQHTSLHFCIFESDKNTVDDFIEFIKQNELSPLLESNRIVVKYLTPPARSELIAIGYTDQILRTILGVGGLGRNRALGAAIVRLKYNDFKDTLQKIIAGAEQPMIYIIASAGGGTGSSLLIPIIAMIKDIVPATPVFTFLILPHPDKEAAEVVANSYALLKEILLLRDSVGEAAPIGKAIVLLQNDYRGLTKDDINRLVADFIIDTLFIDLANFLTGIVTTGIATLSFMELSANIPLLSWYILSKKAERNLSKVIARLENKLKELNITKYTALLEIGRKILPKNQTITMEVEYRRAQEENTLDEWFSKYIIIIAEEIENAITQLKDLQEFLKKEDRKKAQILERYLRSIKEDLNEETLSTVENYYEKAKYKLERLKEALETLEEDFKDAEKTLVHPAEKPFRIYINIPERKLRILVNEFLDKPSREIFENIGTITSLMKTLGVDWLNNFRQLIDTFFNRYAECITIEYNPGLSQQIVDTLLGENSYFNQALTLVSDYLSSMGEKVELNPGVIAEHLRRGFGGRSIGILAANTSVLEAFEKSKISYSVGALLTPEIRENVLFAECLGRESSLMAYVYSIGVEPGEVVVDGETYSLFDLVTRLKQRYSHAYSYWSIQTYSLFYHTNWIEQDLRGTPLHRLAQKITEEISAYSTRDKLREISKTLHKYTPISSNIILHLMEINALKILSRCLEYSDAVKKTHDNILASPEIKTLTQLITEYLDLISNILGELEEDTVSYLQITKLRLKLIQVRETLKDYLTKLEENTESLNKHLLRIEKILNGLKILSQNLELKKKYHLIDTQNIIYTNYRETAKVVKSIAEILNTMKKPEEQTKTEIIFPSYRPTEPPKLQQISTLFEDLLNSLEKLKTGVQEILEETQNLNERFKEVKGAIIIRTETIQEEINKIEQTKTHTLNTYQKTLLFINHIIEEINDIASKLQE